MPRNHSPNPAAANNTTGAAASGSLARVTALASPWLRSTAFRATRTLTGAGNNQLNLPGTADLGALGGITVSATVQWSSSIVPTTFAVALYASDAVDAGIGDVVSVTVTPTAGAVATTILRGVCPAGTRKLAPYFFATGATSGSTITATAVRVDLVDDPAIAYADGDTSGWAWDGTAGNSTSTGPNPAPPTNPQWWLLLAS